MIKAGIIGGSGLTGRELIKILLKHREVKISFITSRHLAGKDAGSVFAGLKGKISKKFISPVKALKMPASDVVFSCLPHTESMGMVKQFFLRKSRVIDLSADFRIKNAAVYKKWYKHKHHYPELLKSAVYGLPEVFKKDIKTAGVIGNPGCYATSILLGILPAVGAFSAGNIIADSKTGISGAGAGPSVINRYISVNENIIPYNIGRKHRHIGEIEDVVKKITGRKMNFIFTPQIAPLDRGILSVIYMKLKKWPGLGRIKKIYHDFYKDAPFVRLVDAINLHNVQDSNFCDINIDGVERNKVLIVITAIDNLVKGASGQAVQNMNIMFGMDEKEGLQ